MHTACQLVFLEVSNDRLLKKLDVKDILLFETRSEIVCGI